VWAAPRYRLIGLVFRAGERRIWLRRRLGGLTRSQVGAIDHITPPVHDLALARRVHCGILGADSFMRVDDETFRRYGRPPAPHDGEGSHHISVFLAGTTRVDLFLQHSGRPPVAVGHPHIAFGVPPRQLLRWKAKLEAHGLPIEGALRLGPPGQASLYFNDPFGNHLELTCTGFSQAVSIRPPVPERLAWDAVQLR